MLKINRQLKIPAIRRCNGMYKQYMNTEATASNVVGILRENHNMWERRAPLTPTQVRKIVESQPQQIKVLVQPCTRRVFSDREYEDAGAIITDDLSGASLIFGVKAPKAKDLQANKCYMFFSHVIKAQPYSMPLLDTILEKNIDLYDYECITEKGRDDTKRLVAFGQFAGQAGNR